VYIGALPYAGRPFSLFCTFLLCMIFGGECKKHTINRMLFLFNI